MESVLIAVFAVISVVLCISFVTMAIATLFAFMGRDFEPIEPKGTVERKETKDKN